VAALGTSVINSDSLTWAEVWLLGCAAVQFDILVATYLSAELHGVISILTAGTV
jgi:hypothetical protein